VNVWDRIRGLCRRRGALGREESKISASINDVSNIDICVLYLTDGDRRSAYVLRPRETGKTLCPKDRAAGDRNEVHRI
jgi:hypothetical protein